MRDPKPELRPAAFVIWLDERGGAGFRGSVEHVATAKRVPFGSNRELIEILERETAATDPSGRPGSAAREPETAPQGGKARSPGDRPPGRGRSPDG